MTWIFFLMFSGFILLENHGCNGDKKGVSCASNVISKVKLNQEEETKDFIVEHDLIQYDMDNVSTENTTLDCKETTEFCFALWYLKSGDRNKTTILLQGCWDYPDSIDCLHPDCIAHRPLPNKSIRNYTRFCCCTGSMCNLNMADNVNLTAFDFVHSNNGLEFVDQNYAMHTILISLASVIGVAFAILLTYIAIRCACRNNQLHDPEASVFLVHPPPLFTSGKVNLDDLKIDSQLHRGRYGEVYKAILNDAEVAVKSLYPNHRQYYYNERDIYLQVRMQHDSIVKFSGYYEKPSGTDGPAQYMIITSFVELGTLTNYLKNNTIDWQVLCRMWHSMASGLAHLHTEIVDGDRLKPTIAHRDFNSRNILVKCDLSCCICDFGLAMKILSPRLADSQSADHEEHLSLADVGTLRYMAPEVLEGSVNLYDCKTSLTQVDVYAMGLVFWEVATRCHDLYQGLPTPEYRLPFEAEIGVHPTFERMQVLVARNKSRPSFPETWKDSNMIIRSLKDTIEECWDQDPEARVSAVCVEERSREMAAIWDIWHRCVTPTINFSHLKDLEDKALVQHNITSIRSAGSTLSLTTGDTAVSVTTEPMASSSGHSTGNQDTGHVSSSYPGEQSISTATIETMMTLSPSDTTKESTTGAPPVTGKPDCNLIYARKNAARQPHQGQNPTVERNTHKSSDEELAVEGNTLISRRSCATHENGNISNGTLLLDAITRNIETGALIPNDILDFQNQNLNLPSTVVPWTSNATDRHHNGRQLNPPWLRAQHRIAFVPNPVEAPGDQVFSDPIIVRPKKQNIPSNGDVNYSISKVKPSSGADRITRLGQLKKQLLAGKSSVRKFSFPSFGWRGKLNQANISVKDRQNVGRDVCPLSSEVCLVDGRAVVRPNSLALNGICAPPNEDRQISNRCLDPDSRPEMDGKALTKAPFGSGLELSHQKANNNCGNTSPSASGTINDASGRCSNENCPSDDIMSDMAPSASEQVSFQSGSVGAIGVVSDGSAGDNMGYEASCSPVDKIQTCLV